MRGWQEFLEKLVPTEDGLNQKLGLGIAWI
jgi:hypothetical protein